MSRGPCFVCGTAACLCGPDTTAVRPVTIQEARTVATLPKRRYPHPSGRPDAFIVADAPTAATMGLLDLSPVEAPPPADYPSRVERLVTRTATLGLSDLQATELREIWLTDDRDLNRWDPDALAVLEALDDEALGARIREWFAMRDPSDEPAQDPAGTPPADDAPADKRRGAPNTARRRPRTPPASPSPPAPAPNDV